MSTGVLTVLVRVCVRSRPGLFCLGLLSSAAAAGAQTVLAGATWPANGHTYQVIAYEAGADHAWPAAESQVTALLGPHYRLATITGADEAEFLRALLAGRGSEWWIGGYQPPDETRPGARWTWVTGERFAYTHWCSNEPNDASVAAGEQHLALDFGGICWNDEGSAIGAVSGYIAETTRADGPIDVQSMGIGITYNDATRHNEVRSVDPMTGRTTLLNSFDFDTGSWAGPMVVDEFHHRFYAQSSGGTLYQFDLGTGVIIGTVRLDLPMQSWLVTGAGNGIGIRYNDGTRHNEVRSVDPMTGRTTLLNSFDFDTGYWTGPIVLDEFHHRFYAQSSGGTLYQFDLGTGAIIGTVRLEPLMQNWVVTSAGAAIGIAYNGVTGHNEVRSVDPSRGGTILLESFDFDTGYWNTDIVLDEPRQRFYAQSSGGTLYHFDLGTGAVIATSRLAPQMQSWLTNPDTDDDGLPDGWETRFGLNPMSGVWDDGGGGDPDGDNVENLQEYHAGTHPRGLFKRYFAEGATSRFFESSLALLNLAGSPSHALLRFLEDDGSATSHAVTVSPHSRTTAAVKAVHGMETAQFSTVAESDADLVIDRTMWWTTAEAYGAHAETAIAAPALVWYLAEGATHSGFNLFYLIANPNPAEAQVRVRYLRPSGAPLEKTYALPPESRITIWVDLEEFDGLGRALAATDVSAVFEVLNEQPIIVERAMYLDVPGQTFAAGHASAGVSAPALEWFLAEGATGAFFDLFILIANPATADAWIEATYLLPDGTTLVRPHTVAANSRFNIWVDREDVRLADTAVSTAIRSTNGVPVIVERAMWWPGPTAATWTEAHCAAGATTAGTRWALAEGEVDAARRQETYILIANPSVTPATARVTLYFEDGSTAERTFGRLPGTSRFNLPVGIFFPEAAGKRFGALVESLGTTPVPIVVERAMYWNALGRQWAAGTAALATRLQ